MLSMVYTGSYMVRNIDGQQDYSNYMRSAVGSYYACIGTGAGYFNPSEFPRAYPGLAGKPLQCSSAVGSWHDTVRNTHQSHEFRLSTNADYRLRGLVGAYWEKFVINDDTELQLPGYPAVQPRQPCRCRGRWAELSVGRRTATRLLCERPVACA